MAKVVGNISTEMIDISTTGSINMDTIAIKDYGYSSMPEEKGGISSTVILTIVIVACVILGIFLGILAGRRSANK